jgi:hypothetical protein
MLGIHGSHNSTGIAQERPHTLDKEWKQATKEYLKEQNSNPIFGVSSKDYKGDHYDKAD